MENILLSNVVPPNVLRVWPIVRKVYLKTAKNAYSHPDDRETAHNVLLRLTASALDLLASGDEDLARITQLMNGDESLVPSATQTDEEDSEEDEDDDVTTPHQVPTNSPNPELNLSTLAELAGGMSGLPGLTNPGGNNIGLSGPLLNAEELQNIFSFMSPYMLGLNIPQNQDSDDGQEETPTPDQGTERRNPPARVGTPIPRTNDAYSEDLYD